MSFNVEQHNVGTILLFSNANADAHEDDANDCITGIYSFIFCAIFGVLCIFSHFVCICQHTSFFYVAIKHNLKNIPFQTRT